MNGIRFFCKIFLWPMPKFIIIARAHYSGTSVIDTYYEDHKEFSIHLTAYNSFETAYKQYKKLTQKAVITSTSYLNGVKTICRDDIIITEYNEFHGDAMYHHSNDFYDDNKHRFKQLLRSNRIKNHLNA